MAVHWCPLLLSEPPTFSLHLVQTQDTTPLTHLLPLSACMRTPSAHGRSKLWYLAARTILKNQIIDTKNHQGPQLQNLPFGHTTSLLSADCTEYTNNR